MLPLVASVALFACGDDDPAGSDETDTEDDDSETDTSTEGTDTDGETDTDTGTSDPCPMLPQTVDEDFTAGPGCVGLNRTEVTSGATLTILPGTTVHVEPGGYLDVASFGGSGTLNAVGSEAEPIVFTSVAAAPVAGDWQCVYVGGNSSATRVEYTTFEYGGQACAVTGNGFQTLLWVGSAAAAVSNNTFQHSIGHGIMVDGDVRGFVGNTFIDNAQPSLQVSAPVILAIDAPHTFEDTDDYIEVDTTFSLSQTGQWRAQAVPWRLVGTLLVNNDANVEIEAGAVIQMDGGTLDVFFATLSAAGEMDNEVVFTSASASPMAGDWGCLSFTSIVGGAPALRNVTIEYAGNGNGCTGAEHKTAIHGPDTMELTNVTFRGIDGTAMDTNGACNPDWCTSNTFDGVVGNPEFTCSGSDTLDC